MRREEMVRKIRECSEPCDLAIIGGGATGMGVAVDAASRGLSVVLVEAHDFRQRHKQPEHRSWCTEGCAIWNKAMFRW